MFIEELIHNKIKQTFKEDSDYRSYLGKESLEEVTRERIEEYQLFKLKRILDYVYQRSSFYKEMFSKKGIKPREIRSLHDLTNIPFTKPSDLANNPYRFLCVSLGAIARVFTFTTSGTTGPKKKIFFTEKDLGHTIDFMAASIKTVGGNKEVVQILLPNGTPMSQADLLARAVREIGGTPVLASPSLSTAEQIEIVKKNSSTILVGSTYRIHRITKEASHIEDLKGLGVKAIIPTSDYLSESMRKGLEKAWDCIVCGHYGTTEMGIAAAQECHAYDGFHPNESIFLFEIIDPETGNILKKGGEGELVFTTLDREGVPLIRYRTHDITRLIDQPCKCGISTLHRIDKIRRRRESIVQIGGGDEIYPSLFDEALYAIPDIVDYQVTLTREKNKDCINLEVEVIKDNADEIKKAITEAVLSIPSVLKNIEHNKMVEPKVELLGQRALKRVGRTKRLIEDKRR